MRRILPCLLIAFSLAMVLAADPLRFRYAQGEKYRLVTEVQEDVYINGAFSHRADILNKIAVQTLEVREDAGLLSCAFQTSTRAHGTPGTFTLSEDYPSEFWRDGRGRYGIGAGYFMPVVRNVPIFPEEEIKPGAAWMAAGEEVHDLRRDFGLQEPFRFPVSVQYRYLRDENRSGRRLAVIAIHYSFFHRLEGLKSQQQVVPAKISGESDQTYFFDVEAGQPESYQERFDFIFHLSNGELVEVTGTSRGRMIESSRLDRARVAEEIREEIEKRGVPDASVKVEEKGVTITLQNIQFPPDSAELLPVEREKLKRIGEILKKYPERDILISGHTARFGTEESSQELSEQRAKAVGDFLLSTGAIRDTQAQTQGFGSTRPLADNAAEEGMRLNRRVEITILEN